RHHRPACVEPSEFGGEQQAHRASPRAQTRQGDRPASSFRVLRSRSRYQCSVHGQGLEEVRIHRWLGIRAIQRREAGRRGHDEDVLFLSRTRQGARLRFHALRTLSGRMNGPKKARMQEVSVMRWLVVALLATPALAAAAPANDWRTPVKPMMTS